MLKKPVVTSLDFLPKQVPGKLGRGSELQYCCDAAFKWNCFSAMTKQELFYALFRTVQKYHEQ